MTSHSDITYSSDNHSIIPFPLTKLRTGVLIFSSAAFFLCVLFLGKVFYLAALTPVQCLIVAAMAAAGALVILLCGPLRKGGRAAS